MKRWICPHGLEIGFRNTDDPNVVAFDSCGECLNETIEKVTRMPDQARGEAGDLV